ncbi:hypothetical protein C5Y96_26715 [Blastopirellula marina]|uniref:Uncharacterized protein n=1 Tax=Blastopirellula marina TaxID=124 RepID=A0A2S8EYX5_9BACT|nr:MULTISPECIES: hypothetical protein [Pirellulaceae]PQO25097.1 hypothetical protein C5Y96_26715 [Blastopirellula marina]RCS40948.1 hypothetical protein DTL36_26760 [Bremerella cremea]
MLSRILIAAIVVTLSGSDVFSAEVSELAKGKVPDAALLKLAPKSGFITDTKTFAKLWKAWRPDQAVPEIDFTKDMVIVGTADGPNLVMFEPKLQGDGDLKFVVASTRMFGPGFGYRLVKIARQGVKSVNGKSIEEGIVQGTITIPDSTTVEQGETIEVKLFEFDPLLADAPAKLIDEKILTEIQHETGPSTEIPFALGSDLEVQKDCRYYITVFVLQGSDRTHIGEIEGKRGLNVVLQNGDRSPVNLILRPLKK